MKPFTNIFIGNNYIANLNASKALMGKIEDIGIDKFINLTGYMIVDDYIVTNYRLNNIRGGPMGYNILFFISSKTLIYQS